MAKAAMFAPEFDRRDVPVELRGADFEYVQLSDWVAKIVQASKYIEWRRIDADEVQSRVVVGIKDLAMESTVRKQIAELGIPEEAVLIEEEGELIFDTGGTVRGTVRPLLPGTIIGNSGELGSCTMGPLVIDDYDRVSNLRGFITASHCTGALNDGVNGVEIYQKPDNKSELVGVEVVDPLFSAFTECTSAGFTACRYSDAALFDIPDFSLASQARLEKIARLNERTTSGGGNHPYTIVEPDFEILSYPGWQNVAVGTEVNKVGQTTGWTYADVTGTCVHWSNTYPIVLFCNTETNYYSDLGDSGAPVFVVLGDGDPYENNLVKVAGVHVGVRQSTGKRMFSPWSGVLADIPNLRLVD